MVGGPTNILLLLYVLFFALPIFLKLFFPKHANKLYGPEAKEAELTATTTTMMHLCIYILTCFDSKRHAA